MMLKAGDKVPDFKVQADDGKDVALCDFRGKRVLLFFFPKANTSG
jgi:thioredoxin-dependent peroxiredoxin